MNRYYYQIVLTRTVCGDENVAWCECVEAAEQYDAAMSLHHRLMSEYPEWCYKFWTVKEDSYIIALRNQERWERSIM